LLLEVWISRPRCERNFVVAGYNVDEAGCFHAFLLHIVFIDPKSLPKLFPAFPHDLAVLANRTIVRNSAVISEDIARVVKVFEVAPRFANPVGLAVKRRPVFDGSDEFTGMDEVKGVIRPGPLGLIGILQLESDVGGDPRRLNWSDVCTHDLGPWIQITKLTGHLLEM